ncbi:MAG: glycosyltransferase family 4 protein [Candidatus Bathyarchaeia archaeon]
MKILHVCPRYFPCIGGVEEHVKNICERLAGKFEVSVFTTDPSGQLPVKEIINGVEVTRFKSWAPSEAYYFSASLKHFLSKYSHVFDIVHAHSYHAFPAYYAAKGKTKNKLVFTPHYHRKGHTTIRSLLHIPYNFLGKKIFEKSDRVICVSYYEKELIKKCFKVNEKKIDIVPNGVSTKEFMGLKRSKPRGRYKTILCVSRLEKYKGIQYLIQVLPLLENDVILEVVGKGPYKSHLVRLAKKLNVSERVKFFQDLSRSELLREYANADVFVLLSAYEAFGLCVAEALCAGVPCIVTKTSALLEWVDNENCFGVDYPICLNELVILIKHVIGKKAVMPKIYDWDEIAEKVAQLYQKL